MRRDDGRADGAIARDHGAHVAATGIDDTTTQGRPAC